jgi:DNA-binding CsgD family transcriptional regulator
MHDETSEKGFLLLDNKLKLVMYNAEAVRILAYPTAPEQIKQLDVFLTDRVKLNLIEGRSGDSLTFSKQFKSGNRRYLCRTFAMQPDVSPSYQQTAALLLERNTSVGSALSQASEMFDFTPREKETVELLMQGLTSKEIAERLKISPNTVKAFVRLVMVKMGVTTRSAVVGKLFGAHAQVGTS